MSQPPVDRSPLRRALVSVYDKSRLVELGEALAAGGVEVVSTGSTATRLREAGVPVLAVEDLTGFPECLDGRVKTLHPVVHAGLLADRRRAAHREQLAELGIEPFDLVVSNLYPFAETVASGAAPDECVEQIDIGGPAMVRAAAKNHATVAVVTSPAQYDGLLAALAAGGYSLAERRRLAVEAFEHTASYDVEVAGWMGDNLGPGSDDGGFPGWLGSTWRRAEVLRYGENPHQPAALYRDGDARPAGGLAGAEQLHGKPMSYNNYVDGDVAWRAVHDFAEPAVAIIKHANPCGVALAADLTAAYRLANACDPVSAFGGVIAVNRAVSTELARLVAEVFTEVVIAPSYDEGALEILTGKRNLRLLRCRPDPAVDRSAAFESRRIGGGLLVQSRDRIDAPGDAPAEWRLVSGTPLEGDELASLAFAWRACRSVKSNAILLAQGTASVGIGMGQVNRVDAARLAVARAEQRAKGAMGASDAFFPFPDGLEVLADAGVRAVVQPGGSVRDDAVTAVAADAGLTMYHTGIRHFAH
ncbi:MAG TPA: bifunctional phosphoribosylaminoimidazolecarboxamide formyltransferase/IMP cyclohydrolase [Nocardioidaceae bacterium]|nr:bifunctional phosphoribosylaminoimidazolecarboxamide formyltransferase/IMP cyclohydrolase [Nocardioidaceae bacterium]